MDQQDIKDKKQNKAQNSVSKFGQTKDQNIHSDVLGSYTGTPEEGGRPVQDADDL